MASKAVAKPKNKTPAQKALKAPVSSAGLFQFKETPTGRVRVDSRVFANTARTAVHLDELDFRFYAIDRKGNVEPVGDVVESVSWTDDVEAPVLTGTMVVVHPLDYEARERYHIEDGTVIVCKALDGVLPREVWRMRVWMPDSSLADGRVTLNLYDDLYLLQQSSDHFEYKATKTGAHKKGWYADEIVRDIARRYRFKVNTLTRGTFRIQNLALPETVSPYAAIRAAYLREVDYTGIPICLSWRNGGLDARPVGLSPPYVFSGQVQTMQYSREKKKVDANTDSLSFATAVTFHGASSKVIKTKKTAKKPTKTVAKGPVDTNPDRKHANTTVSTHKSKLEVTIVSEPLVKQFGYVHKSRTSRNARTEADLREEAKKYLARHAVRNPVLSFTHPGVPWLKAGDALRVVVPGAGLIGDANICFASAIDHQVQAGDYTMTVTCKFNPLTARADLIKRGDDKRKSKSTGSKDGTSTDGSSASLFAACKAISDAGGTYKYGGGHGPKLSTLTATSDGGLDCSSSLSLALKNAGLFPGEVAITSGPFASYGKPGKGKEVTIWSNSGHVFLSFNGGTYAGYEFDTSNHSGSRGPRLFKPASGHTTSGFTPTHPEGL